MVAQEDKVRSRFARRWLRFSLRSIFLATLVIALGLGWFKSRVESARGQKVACEAIEKLGGMCVYDYEYDAEEGTDAGSSTPRWLVDWCGVDPLSDVALIALEQVEVDEAALAHVWAFPRLRELQLYRTTVTDEQLADIASMRRLRVLDVSSDELTDAGVARLAALRSLETLYIGGKDLTDLALDDLRDRLPHTEIYRYGKTPDEVWKMPEDDGTGYLPSGFF